MIGRWLAHIGGAHEDILRQAPTDRAKFTTLGGVLIGTAALAGASAAFAMQTTVKLTVWPAIAVGVVWGLLILSLDRQLVTTMTRGNGWKNNLKVALPRLVLAVLLGAVIAEPLVLRIFDPEIQLQLKKQQTTEQGVAQEEIDRNPRFVQIPEKKQELAALTDPNNAPGVKPLADEVATVTRERDQLNREIGCEVEAGDGCAARDLGEGPRYNENKRKFALVQARLAQLEPQLQALRQGAQDRINADLRNPDTEIGRLSADIASRERDQAALTQGRVNATNENTGLSARMQALTNLGRENTTVLFAHITLFLLFAAIEILPIVAKLLSMSGPMTLYERILARREETDYENSGDDTLQSREIEKVRVETALQLERDRSAAQLEAGRAANAKLVEKQSEIAAQAIDVWGKVAGSRNEEELRRWAQEHTAPARPRRTAYQEAEPPTPPRRERPAEDAPRPARPATVPAAAQPADDDVHDAHPSVPAHNGGRPPADDVESDPLGETWRSDSTRY